MHVHLPAYGLVCPCRYDVLYGPHKSNAGVGVDFEIHMDFRSPQCLKRVRNRTALIRCVFGSTDSYGV
jgi:hypothetical protein